MTAKYFVFIQIVVFSLAMGVLADDGDFIEATVGAAGGVYHSNTASGKSTSGAVDVNGTIMVGDEHEFKGGAEMDLVSSVRDGLVEGDVSLVGRHLGDGRFGIELRGLPFKYRQDDKYWELSIVEVSAILKVAQGGGHRFLVKAGINPFTYRNYSNPYKSHDTHYDPVKAGPALFNRPYYANVYGAPIYFHDPDVDFSYNDNRFVYFGGGTLTQDDHTSFNTVERSVRFPISAEYKYDNGNRLKVYATAYYTLRVGRDSLDQVDDWRDQYDGSVSYSDVYWRTCAGVDKNGHSYNYDCDPYNIQYNGKGRIIDRYTLSKELAGANMFGNTLGGKASVSYLVYRGRRAKVYANGTAAAEVDTHVMDPTSVGDFSTSKRFTLLGGLETNF